MATLYYNPSQPATCFKGASESNICIWASAYRGGSQAGSLCRSQCDGHIPLSLSWSDLPAATARLPGEPIVRVSSSLAGDHSLLQRGTWDIQPTSDSTNSAKGAEDSQHALPTPSLNSAPRSTCLQTAAGRLVKPLSRKLRHKANANDPPYPRGGGGNYSKFCLQFRFNIWKG